MFRGYIAAPNPYLSDEIMKTRWAGMASLTEHHRDALRLLDQLGEDVNREELLDEFGRTPFRLRREAAVALSPHWQRLETAHEARLAGDLHAARKHCEDVLAASPAETLAGKLRGLVRTIDVEQAFAAGKTVNLVPGFTPEEAVEVVGRWETASDGALVHYPEDGEDGEILLPPDIHDDFRLTADIVFAADDDRARAGIQFDCGWPNVGLQRGSTNVEVDRYLHKAIFGGSRVWVNLREEVHVNRRSTLTVEVYHQTVAAWVDSRKVVSGRPLMVWHEEPEQQLMGLYVSYRGDVQDPVLFERLRLEPVTETPPDWQDPGLDLPRLTRPWAGEMPEGMEPGGPVS